MYKKYSSYYSLQVHGLYFILVINLPAFFTNTILWLATLLTIYPVVDSE